MPTSLARIGVAPCRTLPLVICEGEDLPTRLVAKDLVDALLPGEWGPLGELLDDRDLEVAADGLWALTRAEAERYAAARPDQAVRVETTGLLGRELDRYPLNGHRLRSGCTDLDDRPPVPRVSTMPNPMWRE